jgi:pimeloyl-ACP methyl ester carboxylesterase
VPVDGFRLAYDRDGAGPAVVLLHGWPGDHGDFREVVRLLRERADVVAPDLRGFGASDKHLEEPAVAYSAAAQARSVAGLIDELDLAPAVIAGYDIGSRIAQALARAAPERVRALVLSPPLPGFGDRVLSPEAQREFWYHLDRLADAYAEPGAFTASIGWYRAGSGTVATSLAERTPAAADRIAVPTTVLWPEHDPLFPPAWGDRLGEFFSRVTVRVLPAVGHFVPVEAPRALADAISTALDAPDPIRARTENA